MADLLKITSTHVVGSALTKMWAQVAHLSPPHFVEENRLGQLIAVVQITRTDDEEAAYFGKTILDALQDAYFAKQNDDIFTACTRALERVYELITREGAKIEQPTVLIAVVIGRYLYVGRIGRGSADLFRSGALFSLFPKRVDKQIVSGVLQPGDYVILGTDSFYEHAYPTTAIFNGTNSAEDVGDILSPVLLSLPQNADIAAYIAVVAEAVAESTSDEVEASDQAPSPHADTAPAALTVGPEPAATSPEQPQYAVPTATAVLAPHPIEIAAPPQMPRVQPMMRNIPQQRPILYALKKLNAMGMAARMKQGSLGVLTRHAPQGGRQNIWMKRTILIGLLLVLGFGIYKAQGAYTTHRNKQQAQSLVASVTRTIEIAHSVRGQDPQKASSLLDEAQKSLEKAKQLDPGITIPNSTMQALDAEMKATYAITAIENPEMILDLHLIKDTFTGSKIFLLGSTVLAVDTKAPTLLKIDITKRSGVLASGGAKVPNFIDATLVGDTIYALTSDGVFKIAPDSGDAKAVIAKDPQWGQLVGFSGYVKNVYLLDASKGQIWKYGEGATAGTFGTIKNVISTNNSQPLNNPQSFFIDGTFWVTSGSDISHVVDGQVVAYQLTLPQEALGSDLRLTSTYDDTRIYILDKQHQRVVVATKDGNYVSQYKSQAFTDVVDIAVDEKSQFLYLLTPTKLLKIPLSQ